ncbi:deoxyribodipyrimidine photo-lyase [Mucilaginibacter sp. OK268]|uniref:DASH family cryptochrome n=1 Tax=Mucilaginibacter sp. OK268 TaxID=1881048 RepID=UPI0008844592|nr:DASH family cryptochrome [Mucilaginibacter sp. OK268]SDP01613.1 deoxyribodipyrimidine photo-lyase [Mucilaginibacter sp. OK268]
MSEKTILVWFRNDLRIHDNEILLEAVRKADKVLPVYCFDPYYFQQTASGTSKTGNFRARFLIEAVADLRKNLQGYGAELIIRTGNPAEVLPQLAEQYQVNEVYHHREVAYEETGISEQVEAALWKLRLNLKHFIGHTLYHKEDLPFPIKDIPDSFAIFKKKVERDSNVRPCVPTPEHIIVPEITDAGELPTLQQLGLDEPIDDSRATNYFQGGETAALVQLHKYFSQSEQAVKPKGSRGGATNSSKLSPWLSVGCISPRQVYWEIFKHSGDSYAQNASMLKLELLWRDYFRFMFKKHGQKFIKAKNAESDEADIAVNELEFNKWAHGETGVPFIDACMHELNATGYICNQCRQIVATYLVHELKADWTLGAVYFEEKLIDYSPASNWGNWAFIAGVNDAKESKYTIAAMQAKDAESDFVTTWQHSTIDEAGDLVGA